MPALTEIPLTGLASREFDNLLPFELALKADDLYTDQDGIEGRAGSTSVLSTVVSTGTPQHLGRFRPDVNSARTVVVIAGQVFIVTDPTSATAGDGAKTSLGTPFGATAVISGAALNSSYYLSTDESAVPWVRINWTSPDTYTLETLSAIPQGVKPTATVTTALTWTAFTAAAASTQSGCVIQDNSKASFTQMASTWRGFSLTDNGGNDPLTNAYTRYDIRAAGIDFNASGYDWLAIAASPHDAFPDGTPFSLAVQVSITGAANFETIGTIYDIPNPDSPNLIFCDLRTLTAATKAAIRYIQLILTGSAGGKFIAYGYSFLPSKPLANPAPFFVDFLNVATGEFSTLTEELDVTIPTATLDKYPNSRMGNDVAHSSGGSDLPFSANNIYVFNPNGAGGPAAEEIGAVIAITGTAPTFSSPATLLARLWEDVGNGRRLVTSQTVATGASYTFNVGGGASILANQLYKAGGLPPRATSIAAKDQRLIAVYQNRRYISSFVPTSDTTNPFPQWPDIAIEDADGWSADFFPNRQEQGLVVYGNADALYLVSNESWYYMYDLSPNSPSFRVFGRGALGPQAGKWFEDRFFVASWDGVYEGVSRASPIEMSEGIRRIYQDWLLPDHNVCLGYDPDKRAMYVYQDDRYLRYRFPLQNQPGKWTRGTLANETRFACHWLDLVNNVSSTVFTDAWAGMTILQKLQTRANWNKHTASTDDMAYVNNYPPTGVATSRVNFLALYYRSETPASADYSVIAGVYNPITAFGGETYGPAARISTTLDTFYAFVLMPGGICNLIKHVAGVETILATYTIPSWDAGLLNYVNLKVSVEGSTIRGYVQGPSFAPTAPSGAYVLRCSAVDTSITAAGKMGIYGYDGGSAFYIAGATGQQASSSSTITHIPVLALLTLDDYYAFLGGDDDLGTAIPDWVYSTGFAFTPAPAVVKGILADVDGDMAVITAKTVGAIIPQEARQLDVGDFPYQDEVWVPGAGDLRGQKFRVEFTAANAVTLRRAAWSRELLDEPKGG